MPIKEYYNRIDQNLIKHINGARVGGKHPVTEEELSEQSRSLMKDANENLNKIRGLYDEVKKGLDAGGYVSVLTSYVNAYGQSNAHYTTITGMDGARLRILNPSNGDYELTASVSDYIHKDMVAGRGGTVEINYLSKLDKPKELANEYAAQGLSYDEKTKRFSAPMTFESAQNAGQTLGVLVGRDVNEVERAQRSLYVPKQAG